MNQIEIIELLRTKVVPVTKSSITGRIGNRVTFNVIYVAVLTGQLIFERKFITVFLYLEATTLIYLISLFKYTDFR